MKTIIKRIRQHYDNYRFSKEHPGFRGVPYRLAADAFGHTSWRIYHKQGTLFANLIAGFLKELNLLKKEMKILEWGCGPARVIRFFPTVLAGYEPQLYGTDYNNETVQWCRRNIEGISFHLNGLEPPLSFDDNSYDFIFALSVFTHLSEPMHRAWLQELLRVAKPGGAIMFTTHGDMFRQLMTETELEQYLSGRIVVRENATEGKKNYAAFHNPDYVRNCFLKGQRVLNYVEGEKLTEYELAQDVWIIQKT